MSGGHWEYRQYQLRYIAEDIEKLMEINGTEIPKEDRDEWSGDRYYEYPLAVIEKFQEAVRVIKMAQVYIHEIDYLISGDTGEETFLRNIEKHTK